MDNIEFIDIQSLFSGLGEEDKFHLYRKLWKQAAAYKIITNLFFVPLHIFK